MSISDEMLNKIHLGDCIELMKKLPDKSVDLIVTDPPYGMSYRQNHRQEKFDAIEGDDFEETRPLLEAYFRECERILKDDSAIYCFCSWHKVGWFQSEMEKYFKLKNLIVWNKNNHGNGDLKGSYGPKHELVWYAHKGRSTIRGKRPLDVIDWDKVNTHDVDHPTPKPIGLLQVFIEASSDKGQIIFDGFSGSGATAMAAVRLGRKFIGAELEEKYQAPAQKRLEGELGVADIMSEFFK